jgi:hypothetical protein
MQVLAVILFPFIVQYPSFNALTPCSYIPTINTLVFIWLFELCVATGY